MENIIKQHKGKVIIAISSVFFIIIAIIAKAQPVPALTCYDKINCPIFEDNGFSGLARIDDTSFLVVHDAKDTDANRLNRLGILKYDIYHKNSKYYPINIDAWHWSHIALDPKRNASGVASDLEAACSLKPNEFLVIESGHFKDVRRIFHIGLTDFKKTNTISVEVIRTVGEDIEDEHTPTSPNPDRREILYEGMSCIYLDIKDDEGKYLEDDKDIYLIIMGERGGSEVNPLSTLYWGIYTVSFGKGKIKWLGKQDNILAPWKKAYSTNTSWADKDWRDISGLHIAEDGKIWATAALEYELKDTPTELNSIIYELGKVKKICLDHNDQNSINQCLSLASPVTVNRSSDFTIAKKIDGVKLEAISSAQKCPDGWNVASEDEGAGSWWPCLK